MCYVLLARDPPINTPYLPAALWTRTKKGFFRFVRALPFVRARIEREIEGTVDVLRESFNKGLGDLGYRTTLPKKGMAEVRGK